MSDTVKKDLTKAQMNAALRKMHGRKKDLTRFPAERDVLQRFLVEQQIGGLNTNEDGDISHPEVTQWYVQMYCRLNCLRMTS